MPNHRKALSPATLQQLQDVRFRGACKTEDADLFFPEDKGDRATKAKAICARCPVEAECLEYALAADEQHGIWAGKNTRERRQIRRLRRFRKEQAA